MKSPDLKDPAFEINTLISLAIRLSAFQDTFASLRQTLWSSSNLFALNSEVADKRKPPSQWKRA